MSMVQERRSPPDDENAIARRDISDRLKALLDAGRAMADMDAELHSAYDEQWVAIAGGTVLASAPSFGEIQSAVEVLKRSGVTARIIVELISSQAPPYLG